MRERTRKLALREWSGPNGGLDVARLPLESLFRQAMQRDSRQFRSACVLLGSLVGGGKREAGVFLLGLLAYCRDDMEKLPAVVDALGCFRSREAVQALVGELQRIKPNNSTRRYLDGVLSVLMRMPRELVKPRLAVLSRDPAFSLRWRRKFEDAVWSLSSPWEGDRSEVETEGSGLSERPPHW
ncbi:hypothetical protein ACFL5O_05185 [Myxococcota bacterium]